MKEKPWYRQMETIVGLSALFVSLVAVFIAVYSAMTDRAYARASVWPYLEVLHSNSQSGKSLSISIENVGVGPARVKYVTLEYDGKFYRSWDELIRESNRGESYQFRSSYIGSRTIASQRNIKAIETSLPAFYEMIYSSNVDKFQLNICYCSIYDDCWLLEKNGVKAVEECLISEDKKFLQ